MKLFLATLTLVPTLILVSILVSVSTYVAAQGDWYVQYEDQLGVPNTLNICSDADTASIIIQPNIGYDQAIATATLPAGIRFGSLLDAGTFPGITIDNIITSDSIRFLLPVVAAGTEMRIRFTLFATCASWESVRDQPLVSFNDTWWIDYETNGASLLEQIPLPSYAAAIHAPDIQIINNVSSARPKVGDTLDFTSQVITQTPSVSSDVGVFRIRAAKGLSIASILQNGNSINFQKQPISNTDTIIFIDINRNELLEFSWKGILTECNNDWYVEVEYGLDCLPTAYCLLARERTTLANGAGALNGVFEPSVVSKYPGYCIAGSFSTQFRNIGASIDPGFADMLNLSFELQPDAPYYVITSIDIAGVLFPVNNLILPLDNNSLLTQDIDGVGGLTDIDGDGFYDDLPQGESIPMEVGIGIDPSLMDQSDCYQNLSYDVTLINNYESICGGAHRSLGHGLFRGTNQTSAVETYYSPDAAAGSGEAFFLYHEQERNVFNFDPYCGVGTKIKAELVLPQGITLDASTTQLIVNSSLSLPLDPLRTSGDTICLEFDSDRLTTLNGSYAFRFGLLADCSVAEGRQDIYYRLSYYCPDCEITNYWHCDTVQSTFIHIDSGFCDQVPTCDGGTLTTGFDLERTTLGYSDPLYKQPIATSLANLDAALSCDSILAVITGEQVNNVSSDSILLAFFYQPQTVSGDQTVPYFLWSEGVFTVTDQGQTYSYVIPLKEVNYQADTFQTFSVRLAANDIPGLTTFEPGMTYEWRVLYTVNPAANFASNFKVIPDMWGSMSNPGQLCEAYGALFRLGKNQTIVSGPSGNDQPSGCDNLLIPYRVLTANNGYRKVFPNEYRPASRVDSLVMAYDPGLIVGFEDVVVELKIQNHPYWGDFKPLDTLDGSGALTIQLDTLTAVNSLLGTISLFDFRIVGQNTCRALTASLIGDANQYPISVQLYYQENYHSDLFPNGGCSSSEHFESDYLVQYDEVPDLLLRSVDGSSAMSFEQGTAAVDLQVCNQSLESASAYTWLTTVLDRSQYQVDSVINLENQALLPFEWVQDSLWIGAEGLDVASVGPSTDFCASIRVFLSGLDCDTLDMAWEAGWSCYTPTPLAIQMADACPLASFSYTLVPSQGRLAVSTTIEPLAAHAICDTLQLVIDATNVGNAGVSELNFALTTPVLGWTIDTAGIALSFPQGMSPLQKLNVHTDTISALAVQYMVNGLWSQSANGDMPPVDVSPDSATIHIIVPLVIDCGWVNGDNASISIEYFDDCDRVVDTLQEQFLPIIANDFKADTNKVVQVNLQSSLSGTKLVDLQFDLSNLGMQSLDSSDVLRLYLPKGWTYVPLSSSSSDDLIWDGQEPTYGVGYIDWGLGNTFDPNESFQLFSQLAFTSGCSDTIVPLHYKLLSTKAASCGSQSGCQLFAAFRSSLSEGIHLVTIQGYGVSVQVLDYQWDCDQVEQATIGLISNYAQGNSGTTLIIYQDADASGSFDAAVDQVLIQEDNWVGSGNYSWSTDSVPPCAIRVALLIDPASDCDSYDEALSNPTISLISDSDITFCQGVMDTIEVVAVSCIDSIQWSVDSAVQWIDSTGTVARFVPLSGTSMMVTAATQSVCGSYQDTVNVLINQPPTVALKDTIYTGKLPFEYCLDKYESSWQYTWTLNGAPLSPIHDSCVLIQEVVDNGMLELTIEDSLGCSSQNSAIWTIMEDTMGAGQTIFINLKDTIRIDMDTVTYSLDTSLLTALPYLVEMNCIDKHGFFTEHMLDDYSLEVFGIEYPGVDTLCVALTDAAGTTVQYTICVMVIGPEPDFFKDSVYVNQTKTYCLPVDEIAEADVELFVLSDTSSVFLDWEFDNDNICVNYTGESLGVDSVQVMICNAHGYCDTTTICINVIEYLLLPDAVLDCDTVKHGVPLVIDALANDIAYGGVVSHYLLDDAEYGTIEQNLDYSFTYIAGRDICERIEYIPYILCNPNGCDSSFLKIYVTCDDIFIFNAVSANGDGVNDVFYVANIEDYPESELVMFNRWGNEIYQAQPYLNEWNGQWDGKNELPDGTYYYILRLNDSLNRVYKGYVELHR